MNKLPRRSGVILILIAICALSLNRASVYLARLTLPQNVDWNEAQVAAVINSASQTTKLVDNNSFSLWVTPKDYSGNWRYEIGWDRKANKVGSVYVNNVKFMDPAPSDLSTTTGFMFAAGSTNKIEFFTDAGKTGTLLARKYFIAPAAPVVNNPNTLNCGAPATNAFTACFYSDKTLTNLVLSRTDSSVNYGWGGGSPDPKVPADNFSASWEGNFTFEAAAYTFTVTADDGVRLYVDDTLVIDKWVNQSATTYTYSKTMTAGSHKVKMVYYENGVDAVAKLAWAKNQVSQTPATTTPPSTTLPPKCNTAPSNSFNACFFDGTAFQTFKLASSVSTIDYEWGTSAPGASVPADNFSATFVGSFNFDVAEYTFKAIADDGVRVYVDGQRIIDGWKNQSPTTYTSAKVMSSGAHEIKVEYYDSTVGATLHFEWYKTADTPPSPGNIYKSNLPSNYPAPLRVFEVGPGKQYASFAEVPLATIKAGDMIKVYYRAEPYHEKFVIGNTGTAENPIVITGVLGPKGERPIIDGENAKEHPDLDYWNNDRGIIKLSGSSMPGNKMVKYVTIENLEIRNAKIGKKWIGKTGGTAPYESNAACIYAEQAENLTIRNNDLHDCGNGIFIGSTPGGISRDILIQGNYIHDNSYFGDGQHHNVYVMGINMTFEYNYMKLDRDYGNNIKDRSANLVVRYNWIEGGNRVIDAVNSFLTDNVTQTTGNPPEDLVYGNVFIKLNGYDNDQIIHWGGDTEYDKPQNWRKKVQIFNNTFYIKRTAQALGFWFDRPELNAKVFNNVFFAPTIPYYGFDLFGGNTGAQVEYKNNWIFKGDCNNPNGVGLLYCTRVKVGNATTVVTDGGGNIFGSDPGLTDVTNNNLVPKAGSPLIDVGATTPVQLQNSYVSHLKYESRNNIGTIDIGAYEKK